MTAVDLCLSGTTVP